MARIKTALTLRHRESLEHEEEEVAFEAGQTLTVLRDWGERCLCRDGEGRLFNVPSEFLEPEP